METIRYACGMGRVLFDKESGRSLGELDDEAFAELSRLLEAEHNADTDRYVTSESIDYLEAAGASVRLVAFLRQALGGAEGIEMSWKPGAATKG